MAKEISWSFLTKTLIAELNNRKFQWKKGGFFENE